MSYSNEYYLYYITIVQTWNSLNKLFSERIQKN